MIPEAAMEFLSKEAIRQVDDRRVEIVEVPEWGGKVQVRGLTGAERDQFEASIMTGKGTNRDVNMKNVRSKLVVLGTINSAGERLFAPADVAWLSEKSASALERVFDAIRKLSGLTDGDVEELVEDFDDGQSDDSIFA